MLFRHAALLVALSVGKVQAQKYESEPPPKHPESFQQREQDSDGARREPNQQDAYFDMYDRGNSDYKSHIYGEDSDYLYVKPQKSHPRSSAQSGIPFFPHRARIQSVSGEIQGISPVHLQNATGKREMHPLARVRLDDQRPILVDLGPNRRISDFDVEEGDMVQITGREGTIDGRAVLFASKLEVNGHSFQIQRRDNGEHFVDFKGEVEDYRPRWVNDALGNTHRVLEISNSRGETWLVDLPATVSWRDLDLRLGCDYDVRGVAEKLGNEKVLSASSVRVDGEERLKW